VDVALTNARNIPEFRALLPRAISLKITLLDGA
jgi:hypothetical protein